MFENKRLLSYKYFHKLVQANINNWTVKIIENKKTGKTQYMIKKEKKKKKNLIKKMYHQ